jgi:hypothetical protein
MWIKAGVLQLGVDFIGSVQFRKRNFAIINVVAIFSGGTGSDSLSVGWGYCFLRGSSLYLINRKNHKIQ